MIFRFLSSLIAIVGLAVSANVKADSIFDNEEYPVIWKNDWYLDSTITSVHFSSKDYNEKNFGLGLTWQANQYFEMRAGYFKNSYYKQSNYVVANLVPYPLASGDWDINPGIGFGVVSGYQGTRGETGLQLGTAQLGVMPNVSFTYRPLGLRAVVVFAGNAVALQGSFKFRSF